MASLDTRPDVVDITHYGGDTLTVRVMAPWSLVLGKEWLAQIKANRTTDVVDAEFAVTIPAADGDPAFLVLSAAECNRLMSGATTRRVVRAGVALMMAQYTGVWDCQISMPGGLDPVTTLAQGALTIEIDVSRVP